MLTDDLWCCVFNFIPYKHVVALRQVCKRFKSLIENEGRLKYQLNSQYTLLKNSHQNAQSFRLRLKVYAFGETVNVPKVQRVVLLEILIEAVTKHAEFMNRSQLEVIPDSDENGTITQYYVIPHGTNMSNYVDRHYNSIYNHNAYEIVKVDELDNNIEQDSMRFADLYFDYLQYIYNRFHGSDAEPRHNGYYSWLTDRMDLIGVEIKYNAEIVEREKKLQCELNKKTKYQYVTQRRIIRKSLLHITGEIIKKIFKSVFSWFSSTTSVQSKTKMKTKVQYAPASVTSIDINVDSDSDSDYSDYSDNDEPTANFTAVRRLTYNNQ